MGQERVPQWPSQGVPLRSHHPTTSLVQKEVYWGKGRGPGKGIEADRWEQSHEGKEREGVLRTETWGGVQGPVIQLHTPGIPSGGSL